MYSRPGPLVGPAGRCSYNVRWCWHCTRVVTFFRALQVTRQLTPVQHVRRIAQVHSRLPPVALWDLLGTRLGFI
eukprot:5257672-Pyramimonas_sp.AAC.1